MKVDCIGFSSCVGRLGKWLAWVLDLKPVSVCLWEGVPSASQDGSDRVPKFCNVGTNVQVPARWHRAHNFSCRTFKYLPVRCNTQLLIPHIFVDWQVPVTVLYILDAEPLLTSIANITIQNAAKVEFIIKCDCIFRKTRTIRILVKQCNVFIVNFDAQCNQNLRTVIIERN